MSQAQPTFQKTDRVHTLPIDTAGEIARFSVSAGPGYSRTSTIELLIDHGGGETAAYDVEFGTEFADDEGSIHWFSPPSDFSYGPQDVIEDAWQQAWRHVRIMVTEPAATDSEANVALAHGRGH